MKRNLMLAAVAAVSALSMSQPANAAVILTTTPTVAGFTATFGSATVPNGAFTHSTVFSVATRGTLNGTFSSFGDAFGGVDMSVPGAGVTITRLSTPAFASSFLLVANPVFTAGGLPNTSIQAGEYRLTVTGANALGISSYSGTLNFFAVPEPATWAMMLGGFGLVGAATRRSRKAQVTYA